MKKANQIKPALLTHPGVVLEQEVAFRGYTKLAAAAKAGIATTMFVDIMSGKRNITALTAIRLEEAFGIDGMFLLNMQSRFDFHTIKNERLKLRQATKRKASKKK